MPKTVKSFKLPRSAIAVVRMPSGSQPLALKIVQRPHIDEEDELEVSLVAMVTADSIPEERRCFIVVVEGDEVGDHMELCYIGSTASRDERFLLHLFEVIN